MATRAELRRVYRKVPKLDCRGLCRESCGPVFMAEAERDRIEAMTGEPLPMVGDDLTCPLLTDDGRCSVYAARPLVCRLWGVADDMPCPHGCRPERALTHAEGGALLTEMRAIGGPAVGTVPKEVLGAITRAKEALEE